MYTVSFKTASRTEYKIEAQPYENLLELAQRAGVVVDAPCSGNGTCGKCRARLIAGAVNASQGIHLTDDEFADGWRLLCQCTVCADATMWVPDSADSFKSGIQTADLSSAEELERYTATLEGVFAAGLASGRAQEGLGVAIDIGTTTVTAALLDTENGQLRAKASAGNGQVVYGADVINRIICQARPGGVEKLMHAVREDTIYLLLDELCAQAGIAPGDIGRCVVAGNTTMEHLFVGEDAQSIRLEPFVPAFLELKGKTAADIGLPLAPGAPVVFAPNVGSYVGGDITAGVLATLLWNDPRMTLFIDLGTNGEIVLGNEDFMLCCACSAGPAFEGGEISCGMRATSGAIERVTFDEAGEPSFGVVGDTAPRGLCGSGLIDAVAEMFRCGVVNARGKIVADGERVRRSADGGAASYVLAFADETATGSAVSLTETDIDNFIRAKGSIFSAIRTMLVSLDLSPDAIDRVIIAGGIGSGIDIGNAIAVGMLPNIGQEHYSYIGNSSLTGACAMLLSQQAEDKVFDIAHNMTYLELSTEPGYMDEFVAACFIPHTDASLFLQGGAHA